ncbi:MAG: response regulator [Verrucomicrobia bacterium]|nr:response regulator [Verrucomicrobiota bacterium]
MLASPIKIKLVEDNPGDARLFHEMLNEPPVAAFEMSCAGRVDEVLRSLERETFDILLLDLGLPDSQGLATFSSVMAQAPKIPIIVFTGLSDERMALEAVAAGAQDYLVKGQINSFMLKRAIHYAIERKRVEESLRESEERYRSLFDHAHDLAYTHDLTGNFTSFNKAAQNATGYRAEEILGRNITDLVAPEYVEQARGSFARKLDSGMATTYELDITARNGSRVPLEVVSTLICQQGEPVAVLGIARDITERKRTEQRQMVIHAVTRELSESTALGEATVRIIKVICRNLRWQVGGLWLIDQANHVLRCAELWHLPSTEFLELKEASRKMTFRIGVGLPGRVWASGQPTWIPDATQEPNFLRAPAVKRAGLRGALGFPVRVGDKMLGVLEFFSDTIQQADEGLLQMFNILGSQIGQFIERKQLEEQLRQSQKMEAVGQLAGGVAHDFNNLLTIIEGYTELLSAEPNLADGMKEKLHEVAAAAERAAGLTRQLLTFSRKQVIQPKALNLNEVIEGMGKMLRRIIGEDVDLQFHQAPRLPRVLADAGMIEQVILNLAINARDAMPNGGRLIIRTASARIDAVNLLDHSESRPGEFVCLSVRDTGCGMTPEILAHIFEPFFTTKGVGQGTGLGLATVYGIVRQHQGWVEVASQVGQGTSFKVYLPCAAEQDADTEPVAVSPKPRGGTETILLVEDETTVRNLVAGILKRNGYQVLEAASGVAALALWAEHQAQIDLLLTDIVMPEGLNGPVLAKELTAQKPNLRVLYTSGYSVKVEDTAFVLKEGTNFLQKPYQPNRLLQAVRKSLDA